MEETLRIIKFNSLLLTGHFSTFNTVVFYFSSEIFSYATCTEFSLFERITLPSFSVPSVEKVLYHILIASSRRSITKSRGVAPEKEKKNQGQDYFGAFFFFF